MKKYYQLMILGVPLLFLLVHIYSVSAASGVAAYYVGPGETYITADNLDGRVREIINTTSNTLFIPVRTLAEQQSFLNNLPVGVAVWNCGDNSVDPRDSNIYPTVQIGTQCWMKKNLAYLPSVVGPGTGSETISYYYVYGYNGTDVSAAKATTNYTTYGVLYNWTAAMNGQTGEGVQGICPTGWRLPTDAEFTTLTNTTGDSKEALISAGWFNNLFVGYRNTDGSFYNIGSYAYFWSSSASSSSNAWDRHLYTSSSSVDRSNYNKANGCSVRCLRD